MSSRTYNLMRAYWQRPEHARVTWTAEDVEQFARSWPCCDIPRAPGWAGFAPNGDLVDMSDNVRDCEPSGGLSVFVEDRLDDYMAARLDRMLAACVHD